MWVSLWWRQDGSVSLMALREWRCTAVSHTTNWKPATNPEWSDEFLHPAALHLHCFSWGKTLQQLQRDTDQTDYQLFRKLTIKTTKMFVSRKPAVLVSFSLGAKYLGENAGSVAIVALILSHMWDLLPLEVQIFPQEGECSLFCSMSVFSGYFRHFNQVVRKLC